MPLWGDRVSSLSDAAPVLRSINSVYGGVEPVDALALPYLCGA